jgi:maltooligosyltrehalose trehalohydrolase
MIVRAEQTNPTFRSQGAEVLPEGGVRYPIWAPEKEVTVVVEAGGRARRELSLGTEPGGYRSAIDERGRPGDRYKYQFEGNVWPDPASRFNPDGVHGAPQVIDPRDYHW